MRIFFHEILQDLVRAWLTCRGRSLSVPNPLCVLASCFAPLSTTKTHMVKLFKFGRRQTQLLGTVNVVEGVWIRTGLMEHVRNHVCYPFVLFLSFCMKSMQKEVLETVGFVECLWIPIALMETTLSYAGLWLLYSCMKPVQQEGLETVDLVEGFCLRIASIETTLSYDVVMTF